MSLKNRVKLRVLGKVLGHRWVAGPLILGMSLFGAAAWTALPVESVKTVAGLSLILGGFNALRTYLRKGPRLAGDVADELERDLAGRKHATLRELRDALDLGGDRKAVRDVDTLEQHTDRLERGRDGVGFTIPEGLRPTLNQLRESCVASLRKVVRLGGVAQDLSTDAAKAEVHALRDDLLSDVHDAIGQLGAALDRLQVRAVRDDPGDDELPRLRNELDTQLEIARRVEDRLAALEQRLGPAHERVAE